MNKLYIILLCLLSVTLSYSSINNNSQIIGLLSTNFLKQIMNFGNQYNEINKFKKIIKEKSSCVVLIYTISDKNKFKNAKEYFYNSAIEPRITKKTYKYGVTCGVILSRDGIVVTTYTGTMNSDRYIVAVDSEKNQSDELYGQIELNNNMYKAHVIKSFPNLNLVFLQIETNNGEKFDFINISNDNILLNNNADSNQMIYSAIALGKCKGEHFVKQRQTYNAKNKFDMVANVISNVFYKKIKGVPTLILYTPVTGDGAIPENHGGAIIDNRGKLLGIPIWEDYMNIPLSFAIPASTIKLCLKLVLPTILKKETSTCIGLKVKNLNTLQKKLLKNIMKHNTKMLNNNFLNKLIHDQVLTDFSSIQDFIDNNSFGVAVQSVQDGSIADKANILIGDILLQFNCDIILDEETFNNFEAYSIDKQLITLTLLRNNKIINVELRK